MAACAPCSMPANPPTSSRWSWQLNQPNKAWRLDHGTTNSTAKTTELLEDQPDHLPRLPRSPRFFRPLFRSPQRCAGQDGPEPRHREGEDRASQAEGGGKEKGRGTAEG